MLGHLRGAPLTLIVGTSAERIRRYYCFKKLNVLQGKDLQAQRVKIYPCSPTRFKTFTWQKCQTVDSKTNEKSTDCAACASRQRTFSHSTAILSALQTPPPTHHGLMGFKPEKYTNSYQCLLNMAMLILKLQSQSTAHQDLHCALKSHTK